MKIQIEKYLITSEAMNIVVSEEKVSQGEKHKGREYLNAIGYFRTVEQALEFIVQQKIRASSATTIHELLDEVKATREMIRRVMQGV